MTVSKSEYATAMDHARKGTKKAALGEVNGYTTRSFTFEIVIDPSYPETYEGADEFLITVNGRVIKRMNAYQAERMGLIK